MKLRLTVTYIAFEPFIQTSHVPHKLPLLLDRGQLSKSIFLNITNEIEDRGTTDGDNTRKISIKVSNSGT